MAKIDKVFGQRLPGGYLAARFARSVDREAGVPSMPLRSVLKGTPSAFAIRSILSKATFRSPRSMAPA
ncbi:MAG: hypothetical protein JWM57_3512 [Phycisphaerales bacterium]|nr:hypothetical protein [Phycisphaerales bacterium]